MGAPFAWQNRTERGGSLISGHSTKDVRCEPGRNGWGQTPPLELAFRGLGAEIAESGAMAGNIASTRVSEKLGYEIAGEGTRAPRGQPIGETKYRLRRERWRSPISVEIEALEPALPLFGRS
jgi:hypothetical protein